jgi:hypothetical protein
MWEFFHRRRNRDELIQEQLELFLDIVSLLEEIKFSSQCIESHMGCDGHPVIKTNEKGS